MFLTFQQESYPGTHFGHHIDQAVIGNLRSVMIEVVYHSLTRVNNFLVVNRCVFAVS